MNNYGSGIQREAIIPYYNYNKSAIEMVGFENATGNFNSNSQLSSLYK